MSTYGAVAQTDRPNGIAGTGSNEEDALLPRKHGPPPSSTRFHKHLNVNVSTKRGDLILLLCYVITGLLDSCATAEWGSFVSMQTGNTIYFGLGLSNTKGSSRWIKSGTSIAFFCIGSFCFSRFHRYFGQRKRWVLLTSFVVQVVMIVAAALITTFAPSADETDDQLSWHLFVPLAIIAFQSSGQAVTSRALQYNGLTSVVLTSIYCDLFSDAKIFAWPLENTERDRRAAAPILLLIGAFFGGMWAQTDIGLGGALWTATGLKVLIVFAWLFWPADTEDDSN